MYQSKRFSYSYEETEEQGKDVTTIIGDILEDPEFPRLEEVVIGCWGQAWDEAGGAQTLVNDIVANKDKFSHIKSLFVGDMDYEDCEVSWIIQADYSALWDAMPQLEKLVIKGSSNLSLGDIRHDRLKQLEIICGGLPSEVIGQIQAAKLPALEKLLLYMGVEDYGFDGDISTVKELLEKSDFPQLSYLGIVDSEIQDEIVQAVLDCKYMKQIKTLDLSLGTLTDVGGKLLKKNIKKYPQLEKLDLHFHYLSDGMMKKLQSLPVDVDVEEQQEADNYHGKIYYYPMLTE